MGTKNVGQVAGLHIGNTPPENIILIWYDDTPSQMCHKVYDVQLKQWIGLSAEIISAVTYSELVNIAKTVGLSVGKYFKITDKANVLAVAITTTKIQYTDSLGNILIDDLGSNIQYHVTSSNLQIDDVSGVFDTVNNKLVFQFSVEEPNFASEDSFILGKAKKENIWQLVKYKMSSFLSKQSGNSITWNSGFFFSFTAAIKNIIDEKGGVVSVEKYEIDQKEIIKSIENVGKENQDIISNANKAITEATTDEAIYNKAIPTLETTGEPIDVAVGDKLYTIISKIQRYINKFKYATGIRLSKSFTTNGATGKVNNNDTVEKAIAKLQSQHDGIELFLPEDWTVGSTTGEKINPNDLFTTAFAKIEADRRRIANFERYWTTVSLEIPTSSGAVSAKAIKYRIFDGVLEIRNDSWIKVEWMYTRTILNDKSHFYKIAFADNTLQKIMTYVQIGEGDYTHFNCFVLSHLNQISLSRIITPSSGDSWVAPDFSLMASLGFAFSQRDEQGKEGQYLGVALTPASMCKVSGGAISVPYEINENTTFQTLFETATSCRFYIPPFDIRYKLF